MSTSESSVRHSCIVCTDATCFAKGSARIVQALSAAFGIKAGQITPDGLCSLTTARCLGSCELAPVLVLDDEIRGKETPDSITRLLTDTRRARGL